MRYLYAFLALLVAILVAAATIVFSGTGTLVHPTLTHLARAPGRMVHTALRAIRTVSTPVTAVISMLVAALTFATVTIGDITARASPTTTLTDPPTPTPTDTPTDVTTTTRQHANPGPGQQPIAALAGTT